MTASYSVDLRSRVLARKAAGETHREIAAALNVSPSCVSKRAQRKRDTGSLKPAQIGGYKPRILSGENAVWLRQRIASGPVMLRSVAVELAERGIKTHPRGVWVFLHAEGLGFKRTLLPEEQARPDVARRRKQWKACQGRIAPLRLVFIDETWVNTNMAPLRGWGQEGAAWRDTPRSVTGRPSPSSPPYVTPASTRRGSSTDRSTASCSCYTSRPCSRPPCHRATWSSWTTSAVIKARLPGPPSEPRARPVEVGLNVEV